MDWKKVYDHLMSTRVGRGLNKKALNGYYEKHHIVPKCLGGTDNKDNLVLLTYREHVIAHELLLLIYPDNQCIMKAVTRMLTCEVDESGIKKKRTLSAREAEYVRELYIKSLTGPGNPNFGKIRSREAREKQSDTLKKFYKTDQGKLVAKNKSIQSRVFWKNPEYQNKVKDGQKKYQESARFEEFKKEQSIKNKGEGNPRYGVTLSAETRNKISISKLGRSMPTRTQEHRDKISKSLTGARNPHSKPTIDTKTGKTYESASLMCKDLKIPTTTMNKRLKDPNGRFKYL